MTEKEKLIDALEKAHQDSFVVAAIKRKDDTIFFWRASLMNGNILTHIQENFDDILKGTLPSSEEEIEIIDWEIKEE